MPHTPTLRLLVAKAYGRAGTGRKLVPEADRQAMVTAIIADAKAASVFEEPEISVNRVGPDRDGVRLSEYGPAWIQVMSARFLRLALHATGTGSAKNTSPGQDRMQLIDFGPGPEMALCVSWLP